MEEVGKQFEELIGKAVEYGKTTIDLAKLKAVDKISDLSASIISKMFVTASLFFFLLFASLGLALWLGDLLGKVYLGFLAVAALYGILGILFHLLLNKWIRKIICNYIIKRILY